jgi:tetratricopeptide (TPR) repeat protein
MIALVEPWNGFAMLSNHPTEDTYTAQRRVEYICLVLLAGFGIQLALIYVQGYYLNYGYPFSTFLFKPSAAALDFIYPYAAANDPYAIPHGFNVLVPNLIHFPQIVPGNIWIRSNTGPLYFPFAYWIALLFRVLPPSAAYALYLAVSLGTFAYIVFKSISVKIGILNRALVLLLSYPFIFLLDRSNFEIFVFIFLYIFIYYYKKSKWISMTALACAIAMKFYPIFFLLIPLSERRFKDLFITAFVSITINLFGYGLYPGGALNNIYSHLLNLHISSVSYAAEGSDISFNHSLLAGLKYLFLTVAAKPDLELINLQAGAVAAWIVPLLVLGISLWCIFVEKELWKKTALISCLVLLVPASSGDYRLILLYIPFFAWVGSAPARHTRVYALIFGGLFIPKAYYHLSALPEANISIILNVLLMLSLVFMITLEGFQNQSASLFLSRLKQFNRGFRPDKYYILAAGVVLLMVGSLIFAKGNSSSSSASSKAEIVGQLSQLAPMAQAQNKNSDASGYYEQWVLLEPSNAIPRLQLAHEYLAGLRYLDAYREYEKILWLPALARPIQAQAESGLQLALYWSVAGMIHAQEFQRANLLIGQASTEFPSLPEDIVKCELVMQWHVDAAESTRVCFNNLDASDPYHLLGLVSGVGSDNSRMVALSWSVSSPERIREVSLLLGWTDYAAGNDQNAIIDFEKALELSPEKSAYFGLALAEQRAGNSPAACATLQRWKLIDPNASALVTYSCIGG